MRRGLLDMRLQKIVGRRVTYGAFGVPGNIVWLILECGHEVWRYKRYEPKLKARCPFCKLKEEESK